jgi:predicted acetyltransferase
MCGTLRSWPTELTLPGGACLAGSAIAAVSVLPTHRRRGSMRAMLAAEHAAARERGEPLALLHAAEYPIYGRFGYGPACRQAAWTIDTRTTAFHGPATTGIEVVQPSEAVRDAMVGVYEAWRRRQPGEIRRRDYTWDFELGLRPSAWGPAWKGFVALHRGPGGDPDGYARYRAEQKWDRGRPAGIVTVDDLHALTDEAYAALWRFLAELDWAATLKADHRSVSERLPWLLSDARAATISDVGDDLWVRLLDVPRALAARSYVVEGSIVLEIIDPEANGGRLRVELEAGPDGASARPTRRTPGLTIDVGALGAAYLGGVRLRDAVLAAGADEHRTGALVDAERLFRTPDEPWCSTFF